MLVLVIPDSHLKPDIFRKAEKIMDAGKMDKAVCLMDIPDEWNEQKADYPLMYEAVFRFIEKYPDSVFLWGNHDYSYSFGRRTAAYMSDVRDYVQAQNYQMHKQLHAGLSVAVRIDNVVFSHAGFSKEFVRQWFPPDERDVDNVIDKTNHMLSFQLWDSSSPLLARIQPWREHTPYVWQGIRQCIAHTPVHKAFEANGVINTDTFSSNMDMTPYGCRRFVVVDTVSGKWRYADEAGKYNAERRQ